MQSADHVVAGGKTGRKCIDSVGVGDREEWMIQDPDVGKHPWVHIAFDANENLRLRKRALVHLALQWLPEIEFAVDSRSCMNVVQSRIRISDLKSLTSQHAENVRFELTSNLVKKGSRCARDIPLLDALFDVDKHVGEL